MPCDTLGLHQTAWHVEVVHQVTYLQRDLPMAMRPQQPARR
jgi:hypothetical protein